jgi:hypothetical protein
MKVRQESKTSDVAVLEDAGADGLLSLLDRRALGSTTSLPGVVVGRLVGIKAGRTPLVSYDCQPTTAACAARSVVDLRGVHVGSPVVLVFEDGDPQKPIVVGVIRVDGRWPLESKPGQVEVDADGERLVVSATSTLVLRCGRASITLTKDGEIRLEGTRVSSQAAGVNRIKGGSVQIN